MAAYWDGPMPNTKRRGWMRCTGKDSKWHRRQYCYLYEVWRNIRKRCNNPKAPFYKRYGGRGIKVCNAWDDYSTFRIWAISTGYQKGLTIDRIDNDGDYEPMNCRWVTHLVNNQNRSNLVMVKWGSREVPLVKLARRFGVCPRAAVRRYRGGWPLEKVLTETIRPRKTVIPESTES